MSNVLSDAARRLVDGENPAVLATVNPDGSPQTSVVWVGRDGDDLLVSSQQGRRKVLNVLRDPRVSLSVFDQSDPLWYLEVRGKCAVVEDEGRALAVALAEKYEGTGAGEEYLELPPEIVRVQMRISPEKVFGTAAQA
ncbi:PPOX class F420-dependent oxidoreductase [Actinomadura rupiterrae]|uniref:PPOX class F420-dependent oxidoreductase n=1 Tax=Actinomadura rupiterrae TaxID=559627 RepID=UPI0020A533C0|nr:PPOX class F420-dependent oxidoreductase [Actinomadura rupiterrae]MCP2343373.1 PPOX class probable F420-dependent enzyme [Actinomadura rupiterrae]